MRRPTSVNMGNIGYECCPRYPVIFKRAAGACPGNGWGECSCEPASGGFACAALPSDGTLYELPEPSLGLRCAV